MNIAIIANGQIENDSKILNKLEGSSFVIAADGGASHCLRLGLVPDLMIGDFDSVSDEALAAFADQVPKMPFPKDKDETDLELAIRYAFARNPTKISLFAATGYRIDHTLVNLHLLRRFPAKLFIETESETIFALNSTVAFEPFKINTTPEQTISFLPFQNPVKGVTSHGLKWELNNADFDENHFSISNVCLTSKTYISIKSGELLCFL